MRFRWLGIVCIVAAQEFKFGDWVARKSSPDQSWFVLVILKGRCQAGFSNGCMKVVNFNTWSSANGNPAVPHEIVDPTDYMTQADAIATLMKIIHTKNDIPAGGAMKVDELIEAALSGVDPEKNDPVNVLYPLSNQRPSSRKLKVNKDDRIQLLQRIEYPELAYGLSAVSGAGTVTFGDELVNRIFQVMDDGGAGPEGCRWVKIVGTAAYAKVAKLNQDYDQHFTYIPEGLVNTLNFLPVEVFKKGDRVYLGAKDVGLEHTSLVQHWRKETLMVEGTVESTSWHNVGQRVDFIANSGVKKQYPIAHWALVRSPKFSTGAWVYYSEAPPTRLYQISKVNLKRRTYMMDVYEANAAPGVSVEKFIADVDSSGVPHGGGLLEVEHGDSAEAVSSVVGVDDTGRATSVSTLRAKADTMDARISSRRKFREDTGAANVMGTNSGTRHKIVDVDDAGNLTEPSAFLEVEHGDSAEAVSSAIGVDDKGRTASVSTLRAKADTMDARISSRRKFREDKGAANLLAEDA